MAEHRVTHPTLGERVVDDRQLVSYQRTGWSKAGEVVPEAVDAAMDTVLADVGDDPVKAREALAAEQSRTAPRKSLVTALVRVIESADTKEN